MYNTITKYIYIYQRSKTIFIIHNSYHYNLKQYSDLMRVAGLWIWYSYGHAHLWIMSVMGGLSVRPTPYQCDKVHIKTIQHSLWIRIRNIIVYSLVMLWWLYKRYWSGFLSGGQGGICHPWNVENFVLHVNQFKCL